MPESIASLTAIVGPLKEAIVVFDDKHQPLLVNASFRKWLDPNQDLNDPLLLCTQKRGSIAFDLQGWLKQATQNLTQTLWLKIPNRSLRIPVQLQRHTFNADQIEHSLVVLHDLTLKIQLDAQERLMNASFAGQFITDGQGIITQPNYAFCAYTGLSAEQLKSMTYIQWLQKQVSFKVPFDSIMRALIDEQNWSGEVQIFASKEAQFNAILSLSMLMDEHQNIEHIIGVLQDITDILDAQSEISQLAYYDKLTGLANRTLIQDRIEKVIEACQSEQTFGTLFFIDLDGFKIINDTFGHNAGDQLLVQVTEKLLPLVGNKATLARLSGDEFMVLCPNSTQDRDVALQDALAFGSKLLDAIDSRYKIEQHSVHSAASIGICIFPIAEDQLQSRSDQIISYADMAMSEAKKLGGNQTYLFEKSLIEEAKQRLELIEALNHSELDDEFQIYFQAQVDKDGETISAETLLRWFHPELGFVSPAKFIPVAEEGRQIIKIGLWVMHKAFLQAKAWNKKYRPIRIAINISPIQFHEQSFIELIIGLMKFTQVDPRTITLELTEGVLIRNSKLALQKIQHLVSLGFEVSIDDFGTGYSSLSYLQKLPIHELKIDQSFIAQVPGNLDDEAIVDSIIQLASTKNLKIVAEGVETKAQSDFLIQKSPDVLLQGFLYSRPLPAIDFEERYIKPYQATEKTA
ncbi:MAG: EAL domain-containing protein [Thiotrichales bacterium]|nr:EAL domain-containing protein [Thiotrichales bacterium]